MMHIVWIRREPFFVEAMSRFEAYAKVMDALDVSPFEVEIEKGEQDENKSHKRSETAL